MISQAPPPAASSGCRSPPARRIIRITPGSPRPLPYRLLLGAGPFARSAATTSSGRPGPVSRTSSSTTPSPSTRVYSNSIWPWSPIASTAFFTRLSRAPRRTAVLTATGAGVVTGGINRIPGGSRLIRSLL